MIPQYPDDDMDIPDSDPADQTEGGPVPGEV